MLEVRPVIYIMGLLGCGIAAMLCIPAGIDLLYQNSDWRVFLAAAMVAGTLGSIAVFSSKPALAIRHNLRQAFLITSLSWVIAAVLGAVPFVGLGISFTDAVFESMSGITTTGSTVLSGLDSLPPGILLWRALLQWIGGIGIVAIAILMLPLLRTGGMQLFRIERSDTTEERSSSTLKTILELFGVYALLTSVCAFLYFSFGMSLFDAVAHSMATLSTGGYSTHDASFGYFKNGSLHWIGTIFMLCGGIPFYLYIRTVRGDCRSLFTDQQVRGFILFVILASVAMAIWLVENRNVGFFEALTLTSFNVTSVVTTTGFASDDYTAWGPGAVGIFLILMFIGGCSGSTSGSIKIYRLQILIMIVRAHLGRLVSPNRVVVLKYNGEALPDDVPYSILAFLAVFVATIAVFTVALGLMGLDIVTAYSASVTAITNVGPGLGSIIGPAGNFQPLPDGAKWILSFAMLAGRLEVLALLVAFDRNFWRF